MGLDMYLRGDVFIRGSHNHRDGILSGGVSIKSEREPGNTVEIPVKIISSIKIHVGYWRKANHIHAWFVKNVQDGKDDCGNYDVAMKQLDSLEQACKQVLESPAKGPELLPVAGGFFFGSTDYDADYIQDIEHTLEVIKTAREMSEKYNADLEYHSSW